MLDAVGVGAALQQPSGATRRVASRRTPRRPRRSVYPEEKGRGGSAWLVSMTNNHYRRLCHQLHWASGAHQPSFPPSCRVTPPSVPTPPVDSADVAAFPATLRQRVAFSLTCSLRDYTVEARRRRLFNVTLLLSQRASSPMRARATPDRGMRLNFMDCRCRHATTRGIEYQREYRRGCNEVSLNKRTPAIHFNRRGIAFCHKGNIDCEGHA